MDVKKEIKKRKFKRLEVSAFVLVVITIAFLTLSDFSAEYEVDKNRLIIATVQSGKFNVEVTAPGELIPESEELLFSKIDGSIEKIFKYPGSQLKKNDIIAQIYNPELQQRQLELQWEHEALEAEYVAKQAENRNQLLKEEAFLFEKEMRRDITQMEYLAQQKLAINGQAQQSKLDLMKAELRAVQSQKAYELAVEQLKQLKINLAASEKSSLARLTKMEKLIANVAEKIAAQQLISNTDGILQNLSIQLGDQVVGGQSIGKIANLNSLKAILNIKEHQASTVAIGQAVKIDTRISHINGVVKRIEPLVKNGTVIVEVELVDKLPKEARPLLSVNGIINISKKEQTLFVRRPYSIASNKQEAIYKVDEASQTATKTQVTFGSVSGTEIEILKGLEVNDTIIISDNSGYKTHNKIKIIL